MPLRSKSKEDDASEKQSKEDVSAEKQSDDKAAPTSAAEPEQKVAAEQKAPLRMRTLHP